MPVSVELALMCAPRWARTASSSGSVWSAVRLAVVVVVGYIIVRLGEIEGACLGSRVPGEGDADSRGGPRMPPLVTQPEQQQPQQSVSVWGRVEWRVLRG